jgi:hypothetical protein
MRTLAAFLAVAATGCMVVAIKGMITGRPGDRVGYLIRVLALLCFGGAVALVAAAH